jgi:cytochrome P450
MTVLPKLADLEDKAFDPFSLDRLSHGDHPDPYPRLHELRQQGTVLKGSYRAQFTEVKDVQMDDLNQYMVLGYETCLKVLSQPEIFTNGGAYMHSLGRSFGRTVTVMDGTEHQRFRMIFQKAFLPQTVAKWGESVVQPVVDRLMAEFETTGRADLIQQFTHHFAFQVIYSQLELDPGQTATFHRLAVAQLLSAVGLPQGPEASQKLGAFFQELLDQRRATPGSDLVSHLATVEAEGQRLPDDVLISFLRQLVNAGGDTTYRGTSVLLTGLLQHPEQYDALTRDRGLMAQAIEEALRWEGPVNTIWRYVSRDTELDGVKLPQGAVLNVVLASANRDPSVYPDPDKFDIFRERKSRHLAFASGPHVCIGQHLARVEMQRAMSAILDRLPNLRIDPDMPAPEIRGHLLRAPDHLYVRFDPR